MRKIKRDLQITGFFLKRYGSFIIISILVFAGVFAGSYYLCRKEALHTIQYKITTTYYVEYEGDGGPASNFNNIYINGATWDIWVDTEWFLSRVEKKLDKEEAPSRKQLQQYFSARLSSDQRMPVSEVITDDYELTQKLNSALQEVFSEFGQYYQKIEAITVEATSDIISVRAENALADFFMVGAAAGLVFSVLCGILHWRWSLPVYVPEAVTERFGIPAFSVTHCFEQCAKQCFEKCSEQCGDQYRAVTFCDPEQDMQALIKKLPGKDACPVPCLKEAPEGVALLRNAQAVLLAVERGTYGKRLEELLDYMELQNCSPQGILIYERPV